MDAKAGPAHLSRMAGKLMTQAELMAWEQKARRWVLLGLMGLVTGIFGFGLLTLEISYRMLKRTPVMTEAVTKILADPQVREALGEPIILGWAVTGELEDMPDQGTARIEFSLRGPRDHAQVKLRADKSPTGIWKFLLLEVQPVRGPALSCADR